ncbi:hypothetical protein J8273_7287 [Carpediemonas membranifera]|uniref:Transcription initiation factor TFIID subunit 12 domain-containing protein n=1 Tax=Carpediemonas membranifera TaxID=201153 RepID=A0A8J6DZP2_9EUKA|nr:hypothetical protein J8273_7287 [Carpediemonas membranifera]|eukprot:KAG9391013.1 hypothetical protein J8273_7287 [Carpediemonas membranifera]
MSTSFGKQAGIELKDEELKEMLKSLQLDDMLDKTGHEMLRDLASDFADIVIHQAECYRSLAGRDTMQRADVVPILEDFFGQRPQSETKT